MTDQNDSIENREYGIEFGSLTEQLTTHEYPATTEEIVDAYGDQSIELPKGTRTLREVFSSTVQDLDESDEMAYQSISYESADEVYQAIYNLIDIDAVGRERYSDRDSPAIGEERESDENILLMPTSTGLCPRLAMRGASSFWNPGGRSSREADKAARADA